MNFIEIKQSNFRNIGISALPYTISNSIRGEKLIYLIQEGEGGANTSIIAIEFKNISNLIAALQKIQEEK